MMTRVRAGAVCWIAAVVVLLAGQLVAQAGWPTSFSWLHNNISDLGNVRCGMWDDIPRYVCSPWHAWMNAAMVTYGVLLAAGIVLLRAPWLMLAAAAGWVTVGVVPADVNLNVHLLGAILVLGFGNVGLIMAARGPAIRAFAVVGGAVGLLAMVLFLSHHYAGIGGGGMERISAFAMPLWAFAVALSLLRPSREKLAREALS